MPEIDVNLPSWKKHFTLIHSILPDFIENYYTLRQIFTNSHTCIHNPRKKIIYFNHLKLHETFVRFKIMPEIIKIMPEIDVNLPSWKKNFTLIHSILPDFIENYYTLSQIFTNSHTCIHNPRKKIIYFNHLKLHETFVRLQINKSI
jgi:hypothetical protein